MFSECVAFQIPEGVTVVGSGGDADIRLDGEEVLPRHAVISLRRGIQEGGTSLKHRKYTPGIF